MPRTITIPIDEVTFVKELYPRLREDDAAIERYRAAIDKLPPITIARGRVLVDGFHRWQAHKREDASTIKVQDLGELTDLEIRKESLRRNSSHGRQLETRDKRKQAGELYLLGVDEPELIELLSVTASTLETYLRDAKREEKQRQQDWAWDLWLDCWDQAAIAEKTGLSQPTISRLIQNRIDPEMNKPPASRQHFDVWSWQTPETTLDIDQAGTPSYPTKMPPQVVENLLWLYTDPGHIVIDPFAGGGTTIDIAKAMGRRVWSSDIKPSTPTLPIQKHDITTGWPDTAPSRADFILLDPPYWRQAAGRYSDDDNDLGNMTLDEWETAWEIVVKACAGRLRDGGHLAYIISPTELKDEGRVVDHAYRMYRACDDEGLTVKRRIIVTYNTQQATGQQVTWARENKQLLKLYRDLVVFTK